MLSRPRRLPWLAVPLALVVIAAACSSSGGDSGDDTSDGDDGAGEETAEQTEESGADCLVGEWTRNRASYLEGFGGFLERVGGPTLSDESSGDIRLTIDDDSFVATFEDILIVLILPGGAGENRGTQTGEQMGEYTVADDIVTFSTLESTLESAVTLIVGGVETDASTLGIDVDAFVEQNTFDDALGFTCEGDLLTLTAEVPDLDEMLSVSWDRVA